MPCMKRIFEIFKPKNANPGDNTENSSVEYGFLSDPELVKIVNKYIDQIEAGSSQSTTYPDESIQLDINGMNVEVHPPVINTYSIKTNDKNQDLIQNIWNEQESRGIIRYKIETRPNFKGIALTIVKRYIKEIELTNTNKEYTIQVTDEDYVLDQIKKETESEKTPESQTASYCLTKYPPQSLNIKNVENSQVNNEDIENDQEINKKSITFIPDLPVISDKTPTIMASPMESTQNIVETPPNLKLSTSEIEHDIEKCEETIKSEGTVFVHRASRTDLAGTPNLRDGLLSTTDYVENQLNNDYSDYFSKNKREESMIRSIEEGRYTTIDLESAKPSIDNIVERIGAVGSFNRAIRSIKYLLISQSFGLIISLTVFGMSLLALALMSNHWMANHINYTKGNVGGTSSTYIGLFGITREDVCILPDGATITLSRNFIDFNSILPKNSSDQEETEEEDSNDQAHPLVITDNVPIYQQESEFIKRAEVFRDHRAIGNLIHWPYQARSNLFGSSFYDLELSNVKSLMYGGRIAFILFTVSLLALSLALPMILTQYYPQYYDRLNLGREGKILLGYISKVWWLCSLGIHLAGVLVIMIYTRLPTCIDGIGRSVPPSFSINYWLAVLSFVPLAGAYLVYNLKRHDKSRLNVLDEFYDLRGSTAEASRCEEA